ncbi:pyridoxal kinase-like [Halichondria panicea]|uniref:pyridoxal kinase-like n=1 Tax=Halichondria panicea TaxID=6063 RepID=UPI00312B645B
MTSTKRVLSIQSHVSRGYVGNCAATFPLQILGYDVDTIHSVQFSNHTGYKVFKGQVLDSANLADIIDGLRSNNLLNYSHLLTGYVGAKSFLEQVHSLVLELKANNKDMMFVCDPVMGDNGKWYVPQELLPVYRDQLIPLADVITPNKFEAELLSGISIKTEEDGMKVIEFLLSLGAKAVVLTSMEHEVKPDVLVLLAKKQTGECARVEMPKIPAHFTGTGDLFSALLLAWSHEPLQTACEKTVSTVHLVLQRTLRHALELSGGATPTAEQIELRLIQSKEDIERPPLINKLLF